MNPIQSTNRADFSSVDPANPPTNTFVVVVDPTATNLTFGTYLGGSGARRADGSYLGGDISAGIAAVSAYTLFVDGSTYSNDFPGIIASSLPKRSARTAYVSRLFLPVNGKPGVVSSIYLGGNGDGYASGIAINGANVAVCGSTQSTDFPTTGGYMTTTTGDSQTFAFVTQLDANSLAIKYSTLLASTEQEYP